MSPETHDAESDAELARRVLRQGSEKDFRILYRRHTPALYQFVLRLLGGVERDAEDIVQDTWIRAVEGLPRFRWEASFRTWLLGIGLNRTRETLRRASRSREDGAQEEIEPAAPPPRIAERLDLEEAIRQLPAGYREVLLLHDVHGYTHEEIARDLEITAGTSRSQLHFARRALRRHLTERMPHEP
jgi:RNA polymerase sigma-70 factor (ECF subfamily)